MNSECTVAGSLGGRGGTRGEMRSSAHTEVATLHLASSLLSIQALRHISTNVKLLCLLLCSRRYRGTRTHLGPSASDRLCESEQVYLTGQLAAMTHRRLYLWQKFSLFARHSGSSRFIGGQTADLSMSPVCVCVCVLFCLLFCMLV